MCVLKSVVSAPITSQNMTLAALENVTWQMIVAFLTLVGSGSVDPTFVGAIVALEQICNGFVNFSSSGEISLRFTAIDELIRSG